MIEAIRIIPDNIMAGEEVLREQKNKRLLQRKYLTLITCLLVFWDLYYSGSDLLASLFIDLPNRELMNHFEVSILIKVNIPLEVEDPVMKIVTISTKYFIMVPSKTPFPYLI